MYLIPQIMPLDSEGSTLGLYEAITLGVPMDISEIREAPRNLSYQCLSVI